MENSHFRFNSSILNESLHVFFGALQLHAKWTYATHTHLSECDEEHGPSYFGIAKSLIVQHRSIHLIQFTVLFHLRAHSWFEAFYSNCTIQMKKRKKKKTGKCQAIDRKEKWSAPTIFIFGKKILLSWEYLHRSRSSHVSTFKFFFLCKKLAFYSEPTKSFITNGTISFSNWKCLAIFGILKDVKMLVQSNWLVCFKRMSTIWTAKIVVLVNFTTIDSPTLCVRK